jgi:hypothetical protein
MVLQKVGSRVSFLAMHLPGTLKAAIAQHLNVDNIANVRSRGTVVGRLGRPAWKISVDWRPGDARNMTSVQGI